jgi:hypothetical protein
MGLIREPEGVDFVVEPHEYTDYNSCCKQSKTES